MDLYYLRGIDPHRELVATNRLFSADRRATCYILRHDWAAGKLIIKQLYHSRAETGCFAVSCYPLDARPLQDIGLGCIEISRFASTESCSAGARMNRCGPASLRHGHVNLGMILWSADRLRVFMTVSRTRLGRFTAFDLSTVMTISRPCQQGHSSRYRRGQIAARGKFAFYDTYRIRP